MSTRKSRIKPVITDFQELLSRFKRSETFDQEVLRGEISDQIDRLMVAQGVSKAELARRLKKSRAYVTKILQGNANFTLDSLVQISRALGCKYVPAFVPINVWKQIESIKLSASTTVKTEPPTATYRPSEKESKTAAA